MTNVTDIEALTAILELACANREPPNWVELPAAAAEGILAILKALPNSRPGLPKQWHRLDELHARRRLLAGEPVNEIARDISADTGQDVKIAERRLREMKKGDSLKKPRRNKKKR